MERMNLYSSQAKESKHLRVWTKTFEDEVGIFINDNMVAAIVVEDGKLQLVTHSQTIEDTFNAEDRLFQVIRKELF